MGDIKIINLQTGDIMTVDGYQVRGRGLPDGYTWLDEVSKEDLAAIIYSLNRIVRVLS
jgi:hypothetical protein